jgi:hypothetical protein
MDTSEGEFCDMSAIPRNGLTSVEAERLLRHAFPNIESWLCWEPHWHQGIWGMSKIPVAVHSKGQVGVWSWERVSIDYPLLDYCFVKPGMSKPVRYWTGTIRVQGDSGQSFLLFSYLSSRGTVGELYLVSTHDVTLLERFADAAAEQFREREPGVPVVAIGSGDDITLSTDDENVLMPLQAREDIEMQVDQFFGNPELFDAYGLPRRRGFLFVGPPGNGKTMTTRNILRRAWRKFGARGTMLTPDKNTDESLVSHAFRVASNRGAGILVLEDLDSLTSECKLTRAAFLSMLDGLRPKESVLVLASTNNPQDIDPALVHRPSRFDRVWHFDLPDQELRHKYLRQAFTLTDQEILVSLAKRTQGWSFAYLNELRATAAIMSVSCGKASIEDKDVTKAHNVLADQFRSGRKNHITQEVSVDMGFRVA